MAESEQGFEKGGPNQRAEAGQDGTKPYGLKKKRSR